MSRRVFVVDDEKVISDTLSAILRLHGFEAHPFYDAESALAACEKTRPDIVVSDVVMPGMNGVDMAIGIQKLIPSCQILLFSGQASTMSALEAARRDGYNFDFLVKPVHPADLLARLETPAYVQRASVAESYPA